MRIDSSGNVGIGATPSGTSKLDVNGQIYSSNGSASAPAFASRGQSNAGLFFTDDGAASIVCVSAGGSERMRIIGQNGNVGIGTSSPASTLTVAHASGTDGRGIRLVNSSNAQTWETRIGVTGLENTSYSLRDITANAVRFLVNTSGNVGIGTSSPLREMVLYRSSGEVHFKIANGTTGEGTGDGFDLAIDSSGGAYLINRENQPMHFLTNETERMRITSGGNVIINSTTGGQPLTVKATVSGGNAAASFYTEKVAGQGTDIIYFYSSNTSLIGFIGYNGTLVTYNTTSDYRLKDNVVPMTGALAKVAQLKPVTYTWKTNNANGQGFIAHELAEVFPEAVSGEKDGMFKDGKIKPQGIDTSILVATLAAAIQEQQTLINNLTTRLTALEGN
jgi:hypothetical protein